MLKEPESHEQWAYDSFKELSLSNDSVKIYQGGSR